jgi:hypothetical protein
LTFHVEQPTGAEIFWGLFPYKHQCYLVSFQLRNKLAVFAFCSAQNLSLKLVGFADIFNISDENITAKKGTQNTIVVSRVDGMGIGGRELY